jgi:uncharacterized iron-regulated protein
LKPLVKVCLEDLKREPKIKNRVQLFLTLQLCAGLLATIALFTLPVNPSLAEGISIVSPQTEILSQEQLLQNLAEAGVIYLGETHDRLADHEAELQIIQALYAQNPKLAIGLEMFQRPFQPVLDQYVQGEITEWELHDRSEYDRRWGFPWQFYAPILAFAQTNQIPLIALNTPAEVTYQVARTGFADLSPEALSRIPPLSEIDTSHANYRALIQIAFEAHGVLSLDFENFLAAQVLWDETMAESIVKFLMQHPDSQMVVLAGQGHVIYGYGIPDRVDRRVLKQYQQGMIQEPIIQSIILLNPSLDGQTGEGEMDSIADYFWINN